MTNQYLKETKMLDYSHKSIQKLIRERNWSDFPDIIDLIVAIATGCAGGSLWMIVFTVLPIFIVLAPFRIIGTLHISAMVSMLAWLIVV